MGFNLNKRGKNRFAAMGGPGEFNGTSCAAGPSRMTPLAAMPLGKKFEKL
jgi:hypothetical protein